MDNQAQGSQAAAALLRPLSPLQLRAQRERAGEAKAARQGRASVSPAQHKPVLETDEFRVVEPDGTEDPWASADDGVVPDRPAPEGDAGREYHRKDD
ncbi:hypothetical protein J8I26_15080 [Herbaspirillum sp. LeCh32-8]|uniref:hypothetical protein n=1 Tax=Herbaspirillum sp. LeCh32-8 TaxID=2821356 RepID=UPI001AE3F1BE|nr:hypothetical protein [Herbaspirillum sp. LeCh32-8]MBP0599439.1 hypothetical protein [Herbaspirillum sp. LeCh32-8]